MKAAVIFSYGDPSKFQFLDVPRPIPKQNQVCIKVLYTALNPIEAVLRKGGMRFLQRKGFPKILGSDFCGIIEGVGKNAHNFKLGDIVFGMKSILEGGSYAEYIAVNENHISKIPTNFSPLEAAGLPLVALTTYQAFTKLYTLQQGDNILINGASGGVGVYAVQIAKSMGARVTAVTSHRNIELVTKLGADATIDYTTTDILRLNNKFDCFYDAYGNFKFHAIRHLLSEKGMYVSTIPAFSNFLDAYTSIFSNKKAKVVVVQPNGTDLVKIKSMCEAGLIKPIIDSTFALYEMDKAHERLQTKRACGKIIINVSDY